VKERFRQGKVGLLEVLNSIESIVETVKSMQLLDQESSLVALVTVFLDCQLLGLEKRLD
jgi:hypothetical protein